MREFPQELVDSVIKELSEVYKNKPRELREYSTVSKQWPPQIQKHLFKFVRFSGQEDLEKWSNTFKVGTSDVSKYVRHVTWSCVKTLVNFEDHIGAFTQVESVDFIGCSIFSSSANLKPLTSLKATLVHLTICESATTLAVMGSLDEHFPSLRRLCVADLRFEDKVSPPLQPETPRTSLLQTVEEIYILCNELSPTRLDWISPAAQFKKLMVESQYVRDYPEAVNNFITSSGESLKSFSMIDPDTHHGTHIDIFSPTRLLMTE